MVKRRVRHNQQRSGKEGQLETGARSHWSSSGTRREEEEEWRWGSRERAGGRRVEQETDRKREKDGESRWSRDYLLKGSSGERNRAGEQKKVTVGSVLLLRVSNKKLRLNKIFAVHIFITRLAEKENN